MNETFCSSLDLLTKNQPAGHKQLKEECLGMRVTINQAMNAGLTPAEMQRAKSLAEAVAAADKAVDAIYAKLSR